MVPGSTVSSRRGHSVWLLLGHRVGDNAQVLALGRLLEVRLGWHCEQKRIAFRRGWRKPAGSPARNLGHVDVARSAPLTAPWPDVVIGIGYRTVGVAKWIRDRNAGHTRLVRLGRPRSELRSFDLIVATPQYELPDAPNVEQITLPITSFDGSRVAVEAHWLAQFLRLPRPWTSVLIGGPTGGLRLDTEVADKLLAAVRSLHRVSGGGMLVATGPRTPADVTDRLRAGFAEMPALFHEYSREDNPYPAMLRHADSFVVTSDSISMVADAVWQGKPVRLLELPPRPRRRNWSPVHVLHGWFCRRWRLRHEIGQPTDALDRLYRFLVVKGWMRSPRRNDAVWRRLFRLGWIVPLGGDPPSPPRVEARRYLNAELDRVIARIAALVPDIQ